MPETSQAPYATDGTEFRAALKYHYVTALKRFVKYFVIFAPMFVVVFVTGIDYLLPLAIVGFIGLLIALIFFWAALSWTWRCSRVFRRYPLVFRGPVETLQLKGNRVRVLCLGEKGADRSPVLLAVDPLARPGRAKTLDGVWFAGDDVFGGAALVPGSGELLFMQPRDWDLISGQREKAGTERTKRARQAGLGRQVTIR